MSEALRRVREKGTGIDYVTLAGHGEPTLHPKFGAIVSALRSVRDCAAPGASIAVLSNSSTVNRPDVRAALQLADERYMKLDAGDQGLMRRLNGTRLSIGTVVDGLRRLNQVVIQAMFVRDAAGGVDNSSPAAVDAWIQALRIVQPVAVDIYTLDRSPALDTLRPVPAGRLKEIAGVVRDAGLVARVYDRMIGSGDQRVTGRGSLTWR